MRRVNLSAQHAKTSVQLTYFILACKYAESGFKEMCQEVGNFVVYVDVGADGVRKSDISTRLRFTRPEPSRAANSIGSHGFPDNDAYPQDDACQNRQEFDAGLIGRELTE